MANVQGADGKAGIADGGFDGLGQVMGAAGGAMASGNAEAALAALTREAMAAQLRPGKWGRR